VGSGGISAINSSSMGSGTRGTSGSCFSSWVTVVSTLLFPASNTLEDDLDRGKILADGDGALRKDSAADGGKNGWRGVDSASLSPWIASEADGGVCGSEGGRLEGGVGGSDDVRGEALCALISVPNELEESPFSSFRPGIDMMSASLV